MTAEHHLIRMKLLSVLFCTEAPHISQTRWSCSPVLVAWSRGLKQPLSESPAYPRSHRSPRLQFPPVSFAPQRCLPAIPSSLGPDMPQWPCLLRLHHHVSSSAAEWLTGNPRDLLGSSLCLAIQVLPKLSHKHKVPLLCSTPGLCPLPLQSPNTE